MTNLLFFLLVCVQSSDSIFYCHVCDPRAVVQVIQKVDDERTRTSYCIPPGNLVRTDSTVLCWSKKVLDSAPVPGGGSYTNATYTKIEIDCTRERVRFIGRTTVGIGVGTPELSAEDVLWKDWDEADFYTVELAKIVCGRTEEVECRPKKRRK